GQVAGQDVAPVVDVDERRLARGVRALARTIDRPVRQARIDYDGLELEAVAPRPGIALDRAAAEQALGASYLVSEGPIALAGETVEPWVTETQLVEVASTTAVEAVAEPVSLQVDGVTLTVAPDQIAAVLSYRATDAGMIPRVDGAALRELV